MADPLTAGLLIAAAGGVVGLFIRIEHRLTRVETTLEVLLKRENKCPPPLDKNMT
jgi:uncharacterized membrane protein YqgA involved in biofilm formation